MIPQHSSPKASVVRQLLETEGRVMLCLDATRPDVAVPRRFNKDLDLRLILNKNMPQPIDFTATAIESELRFGGIPHYCVIPYDALWGVFNPDSMKGMFWTESMPEEVRTRHGLEEVPLHPPPPPPPPAAKFELRVIEGGCEEPAVTSPEKRTRPNLRLVT
ncbi:MAG: hypothetical protein HQL94_00845 [Magnetococcales bacterium]|nr:hypothetical protein [Magnetococcales bacterium]MBF0437983.1 hypothetical protein [Magnetococcales bacterium]